MQYQAACEQARNGLQQAGWPQAASASCSEIAAKVREDPTLFVGENGQPNPIRVALVGGPGAGTTSSSSGATIFQGSVSVGSGGFGVTSFIKNNPLVAVGMAVLAGAFLLGKK